MPKLLLTTLMTSVSMLVAANAAVAQDAEYASEPAAEVNYFAGADADANGSLSLEEFQVYAVSMAESGDAAYADLLATGEYAKHFAAKDTDADGWLSEAELTPVESETYVPDPKVIDNMDMIEE